MARVLQTAAAAVVFAIGSIAPAGAQEDTEAVAGLYTGNQTEVAAMLELGGDGRYRYQLSYGALDEWSAGSWTKQADTIVLQSDAFVAPAFEVSNEGSGTGSLSVKLDLPSGFDPQYFAIAVHRKDGLASLERIPSGSLALEMGGNPVVSVRPVLAVIDLLGPEILVPEGGAAMKIAFKPNDLGFAGFSGELLKRRGQDFELARHGITIRFRKVDPDQ